MKQNIWTILGLARKDYVILRCIFLFFLLYPLVIVFSLSLLALPILMILGFTFYAYQRERTLTRIYTEEFEDDNLFFRYGKSIASKLYPVRFPTKFIEKEVDDLINAMAEYLKISMQDSIDSRIRYGTHLSEVIFVTDRRRKSDSRGFLKFAYTGLRSGRITHFINFQVIGNYVVIHFDTFMKGIPHWYDVLEFFLASPFRIWFWFIRWLRDDYSILATVSQYLDNSFEEYDLEGYFYASQYTILDSVREFLKENGLLTPELENMINLHLSVHNNNNFGNQINVGGSNNSIAGSILQAIK